MENFTLTVSQTEFKKKQTPYFPTFHDVFFSGSQHIQNHKKIKNQSVILAVLGISININNIIKYMLFN